MHVTILTAGTRGDTQPYIALGLELKKNGYDVRLVAFENFESFIKSYGLDFQPIHGDIIKLAAGKEAQNMSKSDNPLKFFISFRKFKHTLVKMQEDVWNACHDTDAIIYHLGLPIGYFIAQHLNIPCFLANPFPMTPTKAYPSMLFYNGPRFGKLYNILTHKVFLQGFWMAFRSSIKEFWQKEFEEIPSPFSCPYYKQLSDALPIINNCSKFVFNKPDDWNENVDITGYWFLDNEPDWKPSDELLNFLNEGSPPVYIGFGSIGDSSAAFETTELVIKALQLSGQRGILATGWSGMSKIEQLPKNVFMLESVLHTWLFPQMAAVVHHGGAGTTAAGLNAGVPSIIIPHGNDQPAWGKRIYELGVGPSPIPRRKLTAKALADAIKAAMHKDVRARA